MSLVVVLPWLQNLIERTRSFTLQGPEISVDYILRDKMLLKHSPNTDYSDCQQKNSKPNQKSASQK